MHSFRFEGEQLCIDGDMNDLVGCALAVPALPAAGNDCFLSVFSSFIIPVFWLSNLVGLKDV